MKKAFIAIVLGIFLVMTAGSVYAYTAHYGTTEVTYYNPDKAYNGYTLFNPLNTTTTYLIDMYGSVVNTWPLPAVRSISMHGYFVDNGNLLRGIRDATATEKIHNQGDGVVQEVDWDNNVVWEAESHPLGRGQHHDFHKIWNNVLQEYTYIMIASKVVTDAEALELGADPDTLGTEDADAFPDGVIEVNSEGKLIWEWHPVDHTVQDYDDTKANFGVIADHPEKIDINYCAGLNDGDWVHFNSLDYNQALDHIVANGRQNCEFYVVDHGATFVSTAADFAADFDAAAAANVAAAAGSDGDFMYRFGNPQAYDAAVSFWTEVDHVYTAGDEQMWYAHDIQWIDDAPYPGGPDLPGAGNFLIFDNGSHRGWEGDVYSAVLEINPYIMDEAGTLSQNYVDPPSAGYTTSGGGMMGTAVKQSNQIAWSYKPSNSTSFYSSFISGCDRMPNGNTVVCSGAQGHFFEVTEEGEVVWEYVNPETSDGAVALYCETTSNAVFRCHRYGPDHPAVVGQDLTPMGTLTGRSVDPLDRMNDFLFEAPAGFMMP